MSAHTQDGKGTYHTNNSPVIHLSPLTERPFAGRRGENHEDLFATSQEELSISGGASPPYRPIASSSNTRLPFVSTGDPFSQYPPTPAYKSNSRVNLLAEMPMRETDQGQLPPPRRERTPVEDEKPRPTVHYPENIRPFQIGTRQDSSGDYMNSRASSIAGTDDEDSEDYDWSGEEDLVDEEVKFEKRMGVKTKHRGWGFKR